MQPGKQRSRDKRWLLLWIALILAAGSLPYIVAWEATPADHVFAGILINPLDGQSYLAKMRQGWLGNWQFFLTYSPEPHQGSYIFLTYLALGHLARVLGVPLVLTYHAARLAAGLALLLTLYWFLAHLTENVAERRLGFLMASLSAGMGWLGAAFGRMPVDLWVPEGFAFYSLLTNPHFPLAIALMLILFGRVIWPGDGLRRWLLPGLAGLALSLILPFALLPVFVSAGTAVTLWVLFRYIEHRRQTDRRSALSHAFRELLPHIEAVASAVVFSLPVLAYDYIVYTTNPILSAWASQNVTPAPAPVDLLLGYGLLIPFAIVGSVLIARHWRQDRGGLAIVVWAGCTIALVYFPIALQRRLITGLGLPLAMLTALAVLRWLMPLAQQRRWIPPLAVFLSAIGNVFLLLVLTIGAVRNTAPPDITQSRLFLSSDEKAAAEWLLRNAAGEVVLTNERLGMFLPGLSGVRVVYGHEFETIDALTKKAAINTFFARQTDQEQRQEIATRYGADYVVVRSVQSTSETVTLPATWMPVFSQGDITVFNVQ